MSRLRDMETSARIKLALITDPHIGGLEIGVATVNGIVFLAGVVQDPEQRALAEEIARAHGGLDVKNDIEVLGEAEEQAEAAGISAEEDLLIRDRVMGDLESDNRVSVFMIDVDVAGGIVRLSGVQSSAEGSQRAGEIARRVPGVRDVINEIETSRAA